jgi:hypothetical protein
VVEQARNRIAENSVVIFVFKSELPFRTGLQLDDISQSGNVARKSAIRPQGIKLFPHLLFRRPSVGGLAALNVQELESVSEETYHATSVRWWIS